MADNKRRGRFGKGSQDDAGDSIFDLFEPPPAPPPEQDDTSSFGIIPIIRDDDDSLDLTDVEFVEAQAAAEAEAAGLAHWTEPATGQVPAALAAEGVQRDATDVKGPSWRGEGPDWVGPDLSDVFADTAAITHERLVDLDEDDELRSEPAPTAAPRARSEAQPRPRVPSVFDRPVGAPEGLATSSPPPPGPRSQPSTAQVPAGPGPSAQPGSADPRFIPSAQRSVLGRDQTASPRPPVRDDSNSLFGEPRPPLDERLLDPARSSAEELSSRRGAHDMPPEAPAPTSSFAPTPSTVRPPATGPASAAMSSPGLSSPARPAAGPSTAGPSTVGPSTTGPFSTAPPSAARPAAAPPSTARPATAVPSTTPPAAAPSAVVRPAPGPAAGVSANAGPGSGSASAAGVGAERTVAGRVPRPERQPAQGRVPAPHSSRRPSEQPQDRGDLGEGMARATPGLLQHEPDLDIYEEVEEYDEYADDYDEDESSGRSLGQSIVVGIALAAVVFVTLGLGPIPTMILVGALTLLAVMELFNAMRVAGLRPATLLGLVGAVALPAATYVRGDAGFPLVVGLAVVFGMLWYLTGADTERPVLNLGLTLTGIMWIGGLAGFAALMLRSDDGVGLLLATIIITAVSDTLAYLGGKAYGTKSFHSASPNKTWEGTLTGFFGALFAGLVIGVTDLITVFDEQFVSVMVLAAVIGILAPIGDLAESLVKRDLGIKDMGTLLPGHGGVLDRVDGLLFALPGAYYVAVVYQLI